MQGYLYPALFYKDNEENLYRVYFPDIELSTEGAVMEEAFLYAKEFLKAYFVKVQQYDFDFNLPSSFEQVKATAPKDFNIMLIYAEVNKKDLKD